MLWRVLANLVPHASRNKSCIFSKHQSLYHTYHTYHTCCEVTFAVTQGVSFWSINILPSIEGVKRIREKILNNILLQLDLTRQLFLVLALLRSHLALTVLNTLKAMVRLSHCPQSSAPLPCDEHNITHTPSAHCSHIFPHSLGHLYSNSSLQLL